MTMMRKMVKMVVPEEAHEIICMKAVKTTKQLIWLFHNLTAVLRLFFTTMCFRLYRKWRIAVGIVDILRVNFYKNRIMKPVSEYKIFKSLKQRYQYDQHSGSSSNRWCIALYRIPCH